jgi:hypothetical protein
MQVAELISTGAKTFDARETRVFVSFVCPGKEPLMAQLAHAVCHVRQMICALHVDHVVR